MEVTKEGQVKLWVKTVEFEVEESLLVEEEAKLSSRPIGYTEAGGRECCPEV